MMSDNEFLMNVRAVRVPYECALHNVWTIVEVNGGSTIPFICGTKKEKSNENDYCHR